MYQLRFRCRSYRMLLMYGSQIRTLHIGSYGSVTARFAVQPGPGQESVWDYPRPPAILRDGRLVEVRDGHAVVATSKGAYKVMETASPPTFYIPAADIDFDLVVPVADTTYCEWKGTATYWALARNPAVLVGWCYNGPRPRFDIMLKGYLAFYRGASTAALAGNQ